VGFPPFPALFAVASSTSTLLTPALLVLAALLVCAALTVRAQAGLVSRSGGTGGIACCALHLHLRHLLPFFIIIGLTGHRSGLTGGAHGDESGWGEAPVLAIDSHADSSSTLWLRRSRTA
jgi:hypothetical protein